MKNIRHIKALTFIAIILIFILQGMWITNVYRLTQKQIFDQVNSDFENSVKEEMFNRISAQEVKNEVNNINTEIVGSVNIEDDREITSPHLVFQEYLFQKGNLISLKNLDSLLSKAVDSHNIKGNFIINRINTVTGNILETTDKKGKGKLTGAFESDIVYIRADKSEGVQVLLVSPYRTILFKMTLILILSVLLVGSVSFALSYQMRSWVKEKQLRQLQIDFSHALTHDMATPLQTISQVNSMLGNEKLYADPEKRAKYLDIAQQQILNLQALTDRILTVARAESSTLDLSLSSINLNKIILSLVDKFSLQARKNVEFSTSFSHDNIFIEGDETLISNAISNLIDNAIKYSGEHVKVNILCEKNENSLLITIKDDGYGISQKDQNAIFAKFERGNAVKRKEAKGFGLGLAYVKSVIEAHKGTVNLFSKEGFGTEFILYFPLKQ